jgi:hypothetical protein
MSIRDKLELMLRDLTEGDPAERAEQAKMVAAKLTAYLTEFDAQGEFISILRNDYRSVKKKLNKNWDDQFLRRTVVRTWFAGIEGIVFTLKRWTLHSR